MANTFELIASSTVGLLGSASIDFNSIPSTYTDLLVKVSSRDGRVANGTDVYISFNGSTSNLTMRRAYGDSSAAYSSSGSTGNIAIEPSSTATINTFGNTEVYIPNYAGSNNKSYSADGVSENNATAAGSAFTQITAGLWSITSAITSISITPVSGNSFVQYSTAYLYGVKNA